MNQSFLLELVPRGVVALRTIRTEDNENLRLWKNANRFSFFFQEIITPEMQARWFGEYLARADDYMFIALHRHAAIGCMGFRMLDGKADISNVILGCEDLGGRGLMGQALRLMCSFIQSNFTCAIRLDVLRDNPAVDWYRANGFIETALHETYCELTLDAARFQVRGFERLDMM